MTRLLALIIGHIEWQFWYWFQAPTEGDMRRLTHEQLQARIREWQQAEPRQFRPKNWSPYAR